MAMTKAPSKTAVVKQAIFRVPPKMTKWEVREYLTKIYDVPVKKVMTQNFDGKRKRLLGKRKIINYKRASFKRAIVTLDAGKLSIEGGSGSSATSEYQDMKQLPSSSA